MTRSQVGLGIVDLVVPFAYPDRAVQVLLLPPQCVEDVAAIDLFLRALGVRNRAVFAAQWSWPVPLSGALARRC